MNRKIKFSILGVLFFGLAIMIYQIVNKLKEKEKVAEQIKTLPQFQFINLSDEIISNKNLKSNTPLAFIFFSTECDYCHYEVRELKKHIEKFKDYQIYMVCAEKKENISDFVKVYELDKYEQIKVLQDKDKKFYNYFGASVVPSIYIYNRDAQLVKDYKGEVKMEAILNAIESKNEIL